MVFMLKPGHTHPMKPKSYRSIILKSFLSKVMEKIIDRYIKDGIMVEFPPNKNQLPIRVGNPP